MDYRIPAVFVGLLVGLIFGLLYDRDRRKNHWKTHLFVGLGAATVASLVLLLVHDTGIRLGPNNAPMYIPISTGLMLAGALPALALAFFGSWLFSKSSGPK